MRANAPRPRKQSIANCKKGSMMRHIVVSRFKDDGKTVHGDQESCIFGSEKPEAPSGVPETTQTRQIPSMKKSNSSANRPAAKPTNGSAFHIRP
jgi:hypothetical protein